MKNQPVWPLASRKPMNVIYKKWKIKELWNVFRSFTLIENQMHNTSQTSSWTPLGSLRMWRPRNHCKIWKMDQRRPSHRRIPQPRLAAQRRPKAPMQWPTRQAPLRPLMDNHNCKIIPTRASASACPYSPRLSLPRSRTACVWVGYPAPAALPACKIKLMTVLRATTYCNPYYKCEIYYKCPKYITLMIYNIHNQRILKTIKTHNTNLTTYNYWMNI